jgi:hypothetical protein
MFPFLMRRDGGPELVIRRKDAVIGLRTKLRRQLLYLRHDLSYRGDPGRRVYGPADRLPRRVLGGQLTLQRPNLRDAGILAAPSEPPDCPRCHQRQSE